MERRSRLAVPWAGLLGHGRWEEEEEEKKEEEESAAHFQGTDLGFIKINIFTCKINICMYVGEKIICNFCFSKKNVLIIT